MLPVQTNRFDLLRLVFAAVVCVFHAVALTALHPFGPFETALGQGAEVAIEGFFITSGALVAGSLARAATLADYAGKRVRRLYPAYATVILVPALISLVLSRDLPGVLAYLGANLTFLNFLAPNLPGLFEGQRFTEVNGALWTLKIEVMFYLALPLIALVLRRMGRFWWVGIAVLYVGGEVWRLGLPHVWQGPEAYILARQLPGQMAFFASGIALWRLWGLAKARPLLSGAVGLGLVLLSFVHPVFVPVRAAGLTGLIACAAFAPGPVLNAARFGDVSYGVYITHFPILQALVMLGLFAAVGPIAAFALTGFIVFAASLLLWHSVEKLALRPSSHYRQAAGTEHAVKRQETA
ncbi:acyltransferase [Hyphomonas chukchiensis]|uniref:acyltransferase family protein n=1 Tax=Hyphomonas chukchiensis TaxID=1280947 RepID=UPI0030FC3947